MQHVRAKQREQDTLTRKLLAAGWKLVVTLAGTIFVSFGMRQLWYDHNLLNLQPVGLESVELEKKLLSESEVDGHRVKKNRTLCFSVKPPGPLAVFGPDAIVFDECLGDGVF